MSVKIDAYKQVKYFIDGELLFRGDINTTYNKYKSYIRLFSIPSSALSIITFYNKEIYKNIFKVNVLSKQYGIEYDMVSLGFFSKNKLEQSITELYKKLEY